MSMGKGCWNTDGTPGEAPLSSEHSALRARMHTNQKEDHKECEIVALRRTRGTQDDVLMQPSILVPDYGSLLDTTHNQLLLAREAGSLTPVGGHVVSARGRRPGMVVTRDKTLILWNALSLTAPGLTI